HCGQPFFRAPTTSAWFGLRVAGREQPGPSIRMVEGDHPIVDADGQVGHLEFVEPRAGQALEMVTEIVAEQPRGAALERRRPGDWFTPKAGQALSQHGERVTFNGP